VRINTLSTLWAITKQCATIIACPLFSGFGTSNIIAGQPVSDKFLDIMTNIIQLKPMLWEPKNLVRAIEAAGVTLWSWNVDTDALAMDDLAYDLWASIGTRTSLSRICRSASIPLIVTESGLRLVGRVPF
jgi:hypothetical protein